MGMGNGFRLEYETHPCLSGYGGGAGGSDYSCHPEVLRKTMCLARYSKAWLDEGRIDIELKPYKDVDEEGDPGPTPSCVAKPTRFSFDVDSGNLLSR